MLCIVVDAVEYGRSGVTFAVFQENVHSARNCATDTTRYSEEQLNWNCVAGFKSVLHPDKVVTETTT